MYNIFLGKGRNKEKGQEIKRKPNQKLEKGIFFILKLITSKESEKLIEKKVNFERCNNLIVKENENHENDLKNFIFPTISIAEPDNKFFKDDLVVDDSDTSSVSTVKSN